MIKISDKIKGVAKTTLIVGIIASIALAIWDFWMAYDLDVASYIFSGGMKIVLGPMIAYGAYILIYGFGELVEKTISTNAYAAECAACLKDQCDTYNGTAQPKAEAEKKPVSMQRDIVQTKDHVNNKMLENGWWKCGSCGRENAAYVTSCACGNSKKNYSAK